MSKILTHKPLYFIKTAFAAVLLVFAVPNTAFAACTSPTSPEGGLNYVDPATGYVYCDGTDWQPMGGTASALPLSGLTAAVGINTINNAAFAQVWNWNSLTTETAMALGSTSQTTGTIFNLTGSNNNVASTGTVASFNVTGASNAAVPLMLTNAGTGLSFRVNDDGTTTDASPVVVNAAGNVGIGTTTPLAPLHIAVPGTPASDALAFGDAAGVAFKFQVKPDWQSEFYLIGPYDKYLMSFNNVGTDQAYISLDAGGTPNGNPIDQMIFLEAADNVSIGHDDPTPTTPAQISFFDFDGGTPLTSINSYWDTYPAATLELNAGNGGTYNTNQLVLKNTGAVGIGTNTPASVFVVAPPASQAIAAAGTITANACGTIKQISSTGAVTTNTTNTFTAPTASYAGCCMDVVNVDTADTITLDDNANFLTGGGANIALAPNDSIRVCSNGTYWYHVEDKIAGAAGVIAIDDLTDAITDYPNNNMFLGLNSGGTVTTAVENTALGANALASLVDPIGNVAVGDGAGRLIDYGSANTAIGSQALYTSAGAHGNTAIGDWALHFATGGDNTAVGRASLENTSTADDNVAVGAHTLFENRAREQSVAIGTRAMQYAYDGTTANEVSYNTALGYQALRGSATAANNTGTQNTALGHGALMSNTNGSGNIAIGASALTNHNGDGNANIAIGAGSMENSDGDGLDGNVGVGSGTLYNNDGQYNVAIGYQAMISSNNSDSVAIGTEAMGNFGSSGGFESVALGARALYVADGADGNVALGFQAGDSLTTGDNNVLIGYDVDASAATVNSELNIGNTIYGDLANDRIRIGGSGAVGAGPFIANPPAAEAITAAATITANACGTIKQINSTGAVTTGTTNTFTAPTAAYAGCCMDVVNVDTADTITLDDNANFLTGGGANIALAPNDSIRVCSNGTYWYHVEDKIAAAAGSTAFINLTDAPSSYAGSGGMFVKVNSGATGVEFTNSVVNTVSGAAAPTGLYIDNLEDVIITTPANGNVLSFNGTNWVNSVGGGGGAALSAITAAAATNTIANGVHMQNWNWALTGANDDAFTFGETTAATNGTGAQSILKATTLAASTAVPFMVTNLGAGLTARFNDETGDTDTTPVVIDASGKLGVGTATPLDTVHISGFLALQQDSAGPAVTFNSYYNGADRYISNNPAFMIWNDYNVDALKIMYGTGAAAGTSFTYQPALEINQHQEVVFPHANGALTFNNRWNGSNSVYISTDSAFYLWHDGSNDYLRFSAAPSGTAGNNVTFTDGLRVYSDASTSVVSAFSRMGDITSASLGASQNNYNPTGLSTASVIRLTASTPINITGLQGGADGRIITLMNIGANAITLSDDSASSTAANRFALTGNLVLAQDQGTSLIYDSTSSRWRVYGGDGTSSAGAIAIDNLTDAETDYVTDFNLFLGSEFLPAVGGQYNLGLGQTAGDAITTGDRNIAVGYNALTAETTGTDNLAIGDSSLLANNTGVENVAIGTSALRTNVAKDGSTAIGFEAMLYADSTGTTGYAYNTAVGYQALRGSTTAANNTGTLNVAVGAGALYDNSSGFDNTAVGTDAMVGANNTTSQNVAVGGRAMWSIATGNGANTAVGWGALGATPTMNADNSVAIGYLAGDNLTSGSFNIFIGSGVDAMSATGSSQLNIGDSIYGDLANDRIRIGGSGTVTTGPFIVAAPAAEAIAAAATITANACGTIKQISSTGAVTTGTTNTFTAPTAAYAGCCMDVLNVDTADTITLDDNTNFKTAGGANIALAPYDSIRVCSEGTYWYQTEDKVTAGGSLAINDLTDAATDYATDFNLFMGSSAGAGVAVGAQYNLAIGQNALDAALTNAADSNTALGYNALTANTSGGTNTALGYNTLAANVGGGSNVAVGSNALDSDAGGNANTALGHNAMTTSNGSANNVSIGAESMRDNVDGASNVVIGYGGMLYGGSSDNSVAIGRLALGNASLSGNNNIAIGYQAGDALTSGSSNIILGYDIDAMSATGSSQLNIGDSIYGDLANDRIRIGGSGTVTTGPFIVSAPAAEAIAAAATITANACGTIKQINSTGSVTTGTTNTFTAPTAAYAGCCMDVLNVDTADTITLDDNTNFKTAGGANIALAPYDSIRVCSEGTFWYQTEDKVTAGGSGAIDNLTDAETDYATDFNMFLGSEFLPATGGQYNIGLGQLAGDSITTGDYNLTIGYSAGTSITTGTSNTILGAGAMALGAAASTDNTAFGVGALYNVTGNSNVGIGPQAMSNSTAMANANNVAIGSNVMRYKRGSNGVAIGYQAMEADNNGTTADGNIAIGYRTLAAVTEGDGNVAVGGSGMESNTTGYYNVAIGDNVLRTNVAKRESTAVGYEAMRYADSTGTGAVTYNTALGAYALRGSATAASNTGTNNTAIGHSALLSTTSGIRATAVGSGAMQANTSGSGTAVGYASLQSNATGGSSVAIGAYALLANTSSSLNTAIGDSAMETGASGTESVAIGYRALRAMTGDYNIGIGNQAGDSITSGDSNIVIGYNADVPSATGNSQLNIGDSIYGDLANDYVRIGGSGAVTTGPFTANPPAAEAIAAAATITANACGTIKQINSTGAVTTGTTNTFTAPTAAYAGCCMDVVNVDTADTITLDDNANFLTGGGANIALAPNDSIRVCSNGTYWYHVEDKVTGAAAASLSSLTAATGTNTINSGTFAQEWQWNALAGNTALRLSSTSTAAASNTQKMFEILLSGANGTAAQTTYGGYITNTHTGTTSTNVGLFLGASGGATANYALQLDGDTAAQTIAMARETTAATAGRNLTVQAGSAVSGGTNLNGGSVVITPGTPTGSGYSYTSFYAAGGLGTGTTDRTPFETARISHGGLHINRFDANYGGAVTFNSTLPSTDTYWNSDSAFELYHDTANDLLKISAAPIGTAGNTFTYVDGITLAADSTVNLASAVRMGNDITSASLGASQNNYAPTGLSTASVIRLTASTPISITGLTGGADGRIITLMNVGSNAITLSDDSASSTAANRFALTSALVLAQDQGTSLIYDSTSSRWRVYGGDGAGSAGAIAINDLTDAATDYVTDFNLFMGSNAGAGIIAGAEGNLAIGQSALSGTLTNAADWNTAVGFQTLQINTAGQWNSVLGYNALSNNTTGSANAVLGVEAAQFMESGNSNVAVGPRALRGAGAWSGNYSGNTGTHNVAIGEDALAGVSSGGQNIGIGFGAGGTVSTGAGNISIGSSTNTSTTGNDNIALGQSSMTGNTVGNQNVGIGILTLAGNVSANGSVAIGSFAMRYANDDPAFAGWQATYNTAVGTEALMGSGTPAANTGTSNTAIGHTAMTAVTSGSNNVALGDRAADNLTTGSNNITIGSDVDVVTATASNQLNIGNTIYGNLSSDYVGIGNNAPSVALDVTGDIEYTGTITDVSDIRLKTDIHALTERADLLSKIDLINTYSFRMKDDKTKRIEFGVMAQELEKIFPELVNTANDTMGTKSVNYVGLIAPMIEATKDLRAENKALKAEIAAMKAANDNVQASLNKINAQVELLNKSALGNVNKAGFVPGFGTLALLGFGILIGMMSANIVRRYRKSG